MWYLFVFIRLICSITIFGATVAYSDTISADTAIISKASHNLIDPTVRYDRAIHITLTEIHVNGNLERYRSEFDILLSKNGAIKSLVVYSNKNADVNSTINDFTSKAKSIFVSNTTRYLILNTDQKSKIAQRSSDNLILSGICSFLAESGTQIAKIAKIQNISSIALDTCPFLIQSSQKTKFELQEKIIYLKSKPQEKLRNISIDPKIELVTAIQQYLFYLGHDVGEFDGKAGRRTTSALEKVYAASGLNYEGQITNSTLKFLQSIKLNPSSIKSRCSTNASSRSYIFPAAYENIKDSEVISHKFAVKGFGNWQRNKGNESKSFLDYIIAPGKLNSQIKAFSLDYALMALENPNFEYFKKYARGRFNHDYAYGEAYQLDFLEKGFIDTYLERILSIQKRGKYDALFIDYWSEINQSSDSSASRNFRKKLLKKIRVLYGDDFLIIGNVNLNEDTSTHDNLNGAYIETSADNPQGFPCKDIKRIERLIIMHNKILKIPRIVVLDVSALWYGYQNKMNFLSEANVKFARLFSAMVTVLADNGAITYSSYEPTGGIRWGYRYKFQNLEIGEAISKTIKIGNGVYGKKFEHGLIISNSNSSSAIISVENIKIEVPALDGIFCKYKSDILVCF
jgi:hypothetical protein